MDLTNIITQWDITGTEIADAYGFPVLKMQTSNPNYPNCLGKVRLSVVIRHLPNVLAFCKSDGLTTDPATLTNEEIEAIYQFLKDAKQIMTESTVTPA